MKPALTLLTALLLAPLATLPLCAAAGPASALAADGSKRAIDPVWPPEYMTNLPAGYLDRLRHALQLESDKFDSLKSTEPDVIKVRIGIAALALGQHVHGLNACFEAEVFGWKPNTKFGFSLFSAAYVRLYALFNDRTGVMKGRLAPKAQTNLEKSFWECAKVYSKLAEAKLDVWVSEGSENHHVTSGVSDFLVAQFLKDIPAYAGLQYDDGSTPRQQYEARLNYWSTWLDQHARRGLFEEDGSSYENYTLEALFNLRDFAEDPVLRQKADMFLDLVFANLAEETLGPVRGGPKHRTKEEGFELPYYGLLFGQGEKFRERGDYLLSTSSYFPSPVIVSLAQDAGGRGVYSWSKRCPGFRTLPKEGDSPKCRVIDRDNSILRNGFAASTFHMGSHGIDAAAKVDWQSRQQRWQGIVFANHPMARISMDGMSDKVKAAGYYISNPFKTIQDRNVMVTMKWGPVTDANVDRNLWVYFSFALDAVEEEQGWIFVKSGGAFAGVKVPGGYEWVVPWKHSDEIRPKSFVRLLKEDAPVITVVNDASDYNNDFRAFKEELIAEPVIWNDGVLTFATITHEGPLEAGRIDGKPVDFGPSLLNDSPFIRSAWDSGVVFIRKWNETLTLDFSDPQNPRRIVGGPVVGEFPLGRGITKPIVFGKTGRIR